MAFSEVKVTVPDVMLTFKSGDLNYGKPEVKKRNVNLLKSINSKYGVYIDKWGGLLSIPNGVICGFIATESAGTMVGANKFDAVGLMQCTPNSVYECVVNWSKEVHDPMPAAIIAELTIKAKYLMKPAVTPAAAKARIMASLAADASFNILCGCVIIRWMCERFSNGGTALFNRAMIAYNAGAFTSSQLSPDKTDRFTTPNTSFADTATLVANKSVPAESRNYLVKMLGVDGFLDLIYRQNLV